MLTYDLSLRGKLPIYDYLSRKIKEDIISGRISSGEKLPSKRALAAHLKVSVVTVENAYSQLVAEGYVSPVEKRGYFALSVPDVPRKAPMHEKPPIQGEKKFIDLYSGAVPEGIFPSSVWVKLMRRVLTEEGGVFFTRGCPFGAQELRLAIKDHLYREKGLSVSEGDIIVGSGTQHLFELMIHLIGREKRWGLENPGYKRLSAVMDCLEVPYSPVECDSLGMTVPKDGSGISALHISPSHHFPTGAVMPAARRFELLGWAKENDAYIVEDDYDSEFRFVGRPIAPLCELESERVIYFNTFTKSIAPSLRIAYMVLPPHLTELFSKKLSFYTCTVPAFEQHTLARFISEGYFEKHLRRLKTALRIRRDSAIDEIKKSPVSKYTEIMGKDSGFHFLLRLKTDISDADLRHKLSERGVKCAFLSDFCYGENEKYSHTLLINYADLTREDLRRALEIILSLLSHKFS